MIKNKTYLFFFIVVALTFFLRFYQLGNIPFGITNDEAGAIYSSYSIWKTGHDLSGKFLPLSITLDNSFSPVNIYIMAPFVGIFGLSSFSGRLPNAILSFGAVILLFFIAKKLFNDKVALFSSLVLAISPWSLQVGRGVWEVNSVLFFYLLATYIFIKNAKRKSVLWSLPFFLLSFYAYHANKVFFIFYVPLLVFLYRKEVFFDRKKAAVFLIGFFSIITSFLFVLKTQSVSRLQVLLWNDVDKISKTVNWERDKNTAPWFLREVFSNKPLYVLRVIRENYLEAFSPQFLFLYGETGGLGQTFGISFRGAMYMIELPLLLIGIYFLVKNEKSKTKYLILISLLLSSLSTAFTYDKTYAMRCIMMLPYLSILVGYGIFCVINHLKNRSKIIKIFVLAILISFYSFMFLEYLYQYYFRYGVYGAEGWFRSSRDLATYIGRIKNNYKNIYIDNSAGEIFMLQYGIFNNLSASDMQNFWTSNSKKIGNIQLKAINCAPIQKESENLEKNNLYVVPGDCKQANFPIVKIKDYGEPLRIIWKIYEGK